jgi:hypothetical protein
MVLSVFGLTPQCAAIWTGSNFFPWRNSPQWASASYSLSGLHDHTQTHPTLSRTPLDEWSDRRRDLSLTTYNIHNREISMPSAGFEPAIPASERPQTHALDRADTGIGQMAVTVVTFSLQLQTDIVSASKIQNEVNRQQAYQISYTVNFRIYLRGLTKLLVLRVGSNNHYVTVREVIPHTSKKVTKMRHYQLTYIISRNIQYGPSR